MMSLSDKLFNQIKQLSTNITEENYYNLSYSFFIKSNNLSKNILLRYL